MTASDTATGSSTGAPVGSTTTAAVTSSTTSAASTTSSVDPTTGVVDPTTRAGEFIMQPDVGPGCARAALTGERSFKECDVWTQDCPEGQKCTPTDDGCGAWNRLRCVPIDPEPDHPGEPCTVEGSPLSGFDTCDSESMCWKVDEATLTGTCFAFCDGSPDLPLCQDGASCLVANDGLLAICLPPCDPLAQDCPDGELCVPFSVNPDEFSCFIDDSGEEGQVFDACEFINVCDPGLLCADSALATECDQDALGCCLPFCDTTMPACPGAMQQCLPWFDMDPPPPGLESLGLCGLPPP